MGRCKVSMMKVSILVFVSWPKIALPKVILWKGSLP